MDNRTIEGKQIGERIASLIEKNGMTQRQLANKVGITEVSLSRYISGTRIPKATYAVKIANALHTTVDYITGQEKDADPETVFNQTMRNAERYGAKWTTTQKVAIMAMLMTAGERTDK